MRTLLQWAGRILGGLILVLFLAIIAVYVVSNAKLRKRYPVSGQPAALPSDAQVVMRGRHVAVTRGCLDCHGADGGGAKVIDNPAMGNMYGPNLTRGRGGLKAGFGNEDWVRAIRHGIGDDGHSLVLMPSADYADMNEDDLGSLIVFMQSLPAVDRESVPVSLGPVARALLVAGKFSLAAAVIDHAKVAPSQVPPGINPEYGRYLAAGCTGCHNPSFSGGKIAIGPPDWPPASNLTAGPGSAVAHWSEADFIATLRTRRRPDGTELNVVMPANFGQLSDVELKAIWSFLKTLPPKATGQRD